MKKTLVFVLAVSALLCFSLSYADEYSVASLPVGDKLIQYCKPNSSRLALRSSPSSSENNMITRLDEDTIILLVENVYSDDYSGEIWSHVIVNTQEGYIKSEYLTVLNSEEMESLNLTSPTLSPELLNDNTTPISRNYESFPLHSGITFGMTKNEVIDAEKANNFTCQEEVNPFAYYEDDGTYMGVNVTIPVIKGSIAGIQGSEIYYYFDQSDKLIEIVYVFKRGTARDMNEEIKEQYNTIENQINKKYSSIWKDCTENFPSSVDAIDSRGIVYRHSAHKIQMNDSETLYIYHRLSYANLSGYDFSVDDLLIGTGRHFLDYRLVSNSDISDYEKAVQEKEEKEKQRQEDAEKEKQQQLNDDI